MIFHITSQACWARQQANVHYGAPSLTTEGFIHCSRREQLVESANQYFRGQTDLVVLCIDARQVDVAIRYEDLTGTGQQFPHIYGPLNVDAIVDVLALPLTPEGTFLLPVALRRPDVQCF